MQAGVKRPRPNGICLQLVQSVETLTAAEGPQSDLGDLPHGLHCLAVRCLRRDVQVIDQSQDSLTAAGTLGLVADMLL